MQRDAMPQYNPLSGFRLITSFTALRRPFLSWDIERDRCARETGGRGTLAIDAQQQKPQWQALALCKVVERLEGLGSTNQVDRVCKAFTMLR
jgi:hypothetical protein